MAATLFLLLFLPATALGAAERDLARIKFHRLATSPTQAFAEALVIERQRAATSPLQLAKVALAFDMSLPVLARAILESVDRESLTPQDRRGLELYLARIAYADGDVESLSASLDRIDGSASDGSWERLLRAERARLSGDLAAAAELLAAAGKRDALLAYGRFNLATSAMAAGDVSLAVELLTGVARLRSARKMSPEAIALVERAHLALASIAVERSDLDGAWNFLADLGGESEAGIRGTVMLAFEAMEANEFEYAARLWRSLLERHPWHPDVLQGHLVLPWLVENTRGIDAAVAAYRDARDRLADRARDLNAMPTLSPSQIASAINGDAVALELVSVHLGSRTSILTSELSTGESRQAAASWKRLDEGAALLAARRDDLAALNEVLDEQVRRLGHARETFAQLDPGTRIDEAQRRLQSLGNDLSALQRSPRFDTSLETFATAEEQEALRRISTAESLATDAGMKARLERLRRVVWYEIHDDISARVQQRLARIVRARGELVRLADRLNRVEQSLTLLETDEGLPARLASVSASAEQVAGRFDVERQQVAGQLLAAVESAKARQLAAIDASVLRADLALARLQDQRLIAAGDAR